MIGKVTVAKNAGFCSGVRRAIRRAEDSAKRYGKVVMLGDIVHNEKVIKNLERLGVEVVEDIDKVDPAVPVLFRSHGTKVDIWEKARRMKLKIIDATCPLVVKIHNYVDILSSEGRRIIIIGDHGHDEVEAIASRVANPIVISSPEEANRLTRIKSAGVVVQSTQFIEDVAEIMSVLVQKVEDLRFINTICLPTRRRQTQIKEIAKTHNVIVIVGSFNSANTSRLTKIAKSINENSYQVQGPEDIDPQWFNSATSVGVSAGASTPDITVSEVVEKIVKLLNN